MGKNYFFGSVHCGDYVGDLTDVSDSRIKTNVQTLSSALSKVVQMRGVSYDRLYGNRESRVGLIAQELETIAPELVKTGLAEILINEDREDEATITNVKGVNYVSLTAYLIEAIKEQQEQIEELSARIEELES